MGAAGGALLAAVTAVMSPDFRRSLQQPPSPRQQQQTSLSFHRTAATGRRFAYPTPKGESRSVVEDLAVSLWSHFLHGARINCPSVPPKPVAGQSPCSDIGLDGGRSVD